MGLENKQESKPKIYRTELYDIYDSGRENAALFMQLLLDKIENLEAKFKECEEQLKKIQHDKSKDSHNSNQPPSSDNMLRKPKSLRKPTGRKPGGQIGHGEVKLSGEPKARTGPKIKPEKGNVIAGEI